MRNNSSSPRGSRARAPHFFFLKHFCARLSLMIKTRFAPSPTGELHIGSARTALFSYLFAKHEGGEFLLRIEDTDRGRSTKEFEKNILDGLSWLGLDYDGEILYQSKRLEEYKKVARSLAKDGFAVEKKGAIILQAKETLKKLNIKYEEVKRFFTEHSDNKSSQKSYLLRNIGTDLIHGEISGVVFDTVLLRSDGTPTFHLAVVIDDEFMGITHVIRGDDHLSNTPLHIILQKALGYKIPQYAHIPMILGPDRAKLSKRHAATSVLEYKKQGYLPEAIVNFIALLGWNPKDEREIFSLEELIKEFDFKNVNKSGAVFDIEKLDYFNSERLKNLEIKKLKNLLEDFGLIDLSQGEIALAKRGGYKTLKEAAEYISKLRKLPQYESNLLIFKKSDKKRTVIGLNQALGKLLTLTAWSEKDLNQMLSDAVTDSNLANGDVFWPVRVALCGEEKSPSPVELLLALGKDEAIARIEKGLVKLDQLE